MDWSRTIGDKMEDSPTEQKLKKLEKKLDADFMTEVQKSDPAALKERVLKYSREIQNVEDSMKADTKLQAMKEQVKDLSGGYRDAIKFTKARLEYVLAVMKLNGVE
jgi:hypothetical protein